MTPSPNRSRKWAWVVLGVVVVGVITSVIWWALAWESLYYPVVTWTEQAETADLRVAYRTGSADGTIPKGTDKIIIRERRWDFLSGGYFVYVALDSRGEELGRRHSETITLPLLRARRASSRQ